MYNDRMIDILSFLSFGKLTALESCSQLSQVCPYLPQQEFRKNRAASRTFEAMERVLFAGLQILSVLSFTAPASSSRPNIIFILADDLVSMV